MQKMTRYIALLLLCFATTMVAQDLPVEDIISDIYHEIADDADIPFEQLEEDLLNLAQHPINLNQATYQDLSQLPFLNDQQIDAILLHQYQTPFQSVYELQLVDNLDTYDIRNLLPFVYVGPSEKTTQLTFSSLFKPGDHELTVRTDLRNLEQFDGDPVYAKLRYRFNSKHLQAGITLTRPAGAPIRELEHGAYIQLNDIGPLKTIVAGSYQAQFGYGLVVGSPFKRGKTSYIQSTVTAQQGLRKFSSSGEDYNHFHGIGATAQDKHGKQLPAETASFSAAFEIDQYDGKNRNAKACDNTKNRLNDCVKLHRKPPLSILTIVYLIARYKGVTDRNDFSKIFWGRFRAYMPG